MPLLYISIMLITYAVPLFSGTMELEKKTKIKKTKILSPNSSEPLTEEKIELLEAKPSAEMDELSGKDELKEDEHEIL